MKSLLISCLAVCFTATLSNAMAADPASEVKPAPNGIELPSGYKNWRVIAVSHRSDNGSLRAILGNDIAVEAARAGDTKPWPNGTVLAKLVWKNRTDDHWPAATVPGKFVHAEFMIKDAAKYADTLGWGWARWLGTEQKPYGKDASFSQECVGCHTPVKSQDYVFTRPVILP